MEENHRRYRRSVFIPLILIVLGVVLLLYNFGLISGDAWEIIFRLWPVLLVALGLDSVLRGEGLVGPIFIIGIGAAFLSSTLGFLDITVWELILTLWPLFLIAIGLDIALGHRSIAWSLVAVSVFLLVLIGAIWLLFSPVADNRVGEDIYQPLEGATLAKLVIEPAVGTLVIQSHQDEEVLIEGEVRLARRESVSSEFNIVNGIATFTLRSTGFVFFAFPGEKQPWNWNLALSQDIPLDLKIAMGAGVSQIDLTDLHINHLDLNVSVGETRLILPQNGNLQATIENAIGSTTIILPPSMSMRLTADTGLATIQVPGDFEHQEDVYSSPGYDSAENRIDLNINQAIGVVRVKYADEGVGILTGLTSVPLHAAGLPVGLP
jgi:hypothetical protein